jgi:hypothetical protein
MLMASTPLSKDTPLSPIHRSTRQKNQTEKEYRKIISFTIHLGISLTKDVKDFYKENYKPLKKERKKHYRGWKDPPCSWVGRINFVKMATLSKACSVQSPSKFQ